MIYFSDGICRLLGYSREEYEKLSDPDPLNLAHAEDRALIFAQLDALKRTNAQIECAFRIKAKSGKYLWVDFRGSSAERQGESVVVNAAIFVLNRQKEAETLRRMDERK